MFKPPRKIQEYGEARTVLKVTVDVEVKERSSVDPEESCQECTDPGGGAVWREVSPELIE